MNPVEVYKRSNSLTSESAGIRRPVAPEKISRVTSPTYSQAQRSIKSDGGDAVRISISSAARGYSEISEKSASKADSRQKVSAPNQNSNPSLSAVA